MSDAYESALAEYGLEDVQPRYRHLLLQLKANDPKAYERAVERYKDNVEGLQNDDDVLRAWVDYGAWLAGEVAPGSLVSIDVNGRSRRADTPPQLGAFLMQVPDEARQRAVVVTLPSSPSAAQRETVSLLCD